MKKIITLLFLVVLYSCDQYNSNEKFEKKTVENKYSLSVPESLGTTTELNDVASLQLQNGLEDFYVIVIDEPKKDFLEGVENNLINATPDLDGFYSIITNHFKKVMPQEYKLYDIKKKKINSANAIVFSMSGVVDGNSIFYRYAVVQSDQRYYQIMTWTSGQQEKKYTERMNKIIESFNVEEIGYSKGKSHLAKDKTKNKKLEEINTVKLDYEIQEIGNIYRPEIMQQEKIKMKNGTNNYQYTLTNSDLLDEDLKNIKKHSAKIANNYYSLLQRTTPSFSFNKIIVKIVHRNGKIDSFKYSEKEIQSIEL